VDGPCLRCLDGDGTRDGPNQHLQDVAWKSWAGQKMDDHTMGGWGLTLLAGAERVDDPRGVNRRVRLAGRSAGDVVPKDGQSCDLHHPRGAGGMLDDPCLRLLDAGGRNWAGQRRDGRRMGGWSLHPRAGAGQKKAGRRKAAARRGEVKTAGPRRDGRKCAVVRWDDLPAAWRHGQKVAWMWALNPLDGYRVGRPAVCQREALLRHGQSRGCLDYQSCARGDGHWRSLHCRDCRDGQKNDLRGRRLHGLGSGRNGHSRGEVLH